MGSTDEELDELAELLKSIDEFSPVDPRHRREEEPLDSGWRDPGSVDSSGSSDNEEGTILDELLASYASEEPDGRTLEELVELHEPEPEYDEEAAPEPETNEGRLWSSAFII
eukprot:SAG11_NODE_478_length_9117_cov_6.916168_14_plen_112_part_00